MSLHPRILAALEAGARLPAYDTLPIAAARAQVKAGYPMRVPPIPVGAVDDRVIAGGIPVRVYSPEGAGPHPLVMFFHGSGFVLLDLDSHDDLCRRLCRGARALVVSVDYRLAPEHKFPAAPDDCLAATRWAAAYAGADPTRIFVAGDSAGGCLAAVTALRIREEGGPALRGQLLFYPVTDYPSAPYQRCVTGYGLTARGMQWFWDQYLPDRSSAADWRASPLRAASFERLPAACIFTAEFDVLCDEGEAYAARLRAAGVPVEARCCGGLNHGFLKWADEIEAVDSVIGAACAWLIGSKRIKN